MVENRANLKVGVSNGCFFNGVQRAFPKAELIIKNTYEILGKFDLILFAGGADVNPRLYGENCTHSSYVPELDEFELGIWNNSRRLNIPAFGICRGVQFLSAMSGGRIVQDIALELGISHGFNHGISPTTNVPTRSIGTMNKFFTEFVPKTTNSMHHQCVDIRHGGAFRVMYTASSGAIPELILGNEGWMGTQFHPEATTGAEIEKFWDGVVSIWLPYAKAQLDSRISN